MASAGGSRGRIAVIAIAVAVLVGVAFLLVEPRLTDSDGPACDAPFAEPIDPLSSMHLLPDALEPPYVTNPPTSGAHRPGQHPTGALDTEIARSVQVSMLEGGEALIQYRSASGAARRELRALARDGNHVTVAPNKSLDSKIVATAWLWKMTCSRVDTKALQDFVSAHRLEAPTH